MPPRQRGELPIPAPARLAQSAAIKTITILSAILLAGCATQPPIPPPARTGSYWDGEGMTGSPRVRISLSEQRAYFYKGEQLAGVSLISTGSENLETVTGDFHIVEKQRYHESSLFGAYLAADGRVVQRDVDTRKDRRPPGTHYAGAPMPFWMRIVGGIGMHKGHLPGYPASHGCIRLPGEMAEAFYGAVSVGTPVRIEQ